MTITAAPIVFTIFTFPAFIICSWLLARSLYNYQKQANTKPHKQATKSLIKLSLTSMSLFTISLLIYVVHFLLYLSFGHKIDALIQLNNFCYIAGIFTALYVWIQRLDVAFQNSANGFSPKYIRFLRILYCITITMGFSIALEHTIVVALDLTRIISVIFGMFFAILFASLSITVFCSFILKMKQSIKLSKAVSESVNHQTVNIGKHLVSLLVKLTILSVMCIVSTFCALMACTFIIMCRSSVSWMFMQLPLVIDDFVGFISLYCAWSINKKHYYKLCGCIHAMILNKRRDELSITGTDGASTMSSVNQTQCGSTEPVSPDSCSV